MISITVLGKPHYYKKVTGLLMESMYRFIYIRFELLNVYFADGQYKIKSLPASKMVMKFVVELSYNSRSFSG